MSDTKLEIKGVDVSMIRNRHENRVADIQDIYALTLNLIPAGYTQKGSIVLSDRLSGYEIKSKIRTAVERVLEHPTRTDR